MHRFSDGVFLPLSIRLRVLQESVSSLVDKDGMITATNYRLHKYRISQLVGVSMIGTAMLIANLCCQHCLTF